MLALTAMFAIWLGREVKFVRERKAFLKWVDDTGGAYGPKVIDSGHPSQAAVPFWRRWLGDFGVVAIGLGKGYETDYKRANDARRLFPEAHVFPENSPR